MKTSQNISLSKEEEEELEPVSPTGRLMHAPKFNLFVMLVMCYNTKIDPNVYRKCASQTLLKHPRFSSLLIKSDDGKFRWKRTTTDIEKHIYFTDVDPNMENPDEFVADFASNLSVSPLDMTKPLWEAYILNVKTSNAESVVVARLHHSLGDGVSLIALTHACARRIDDPDSLPEFPSSSSKKKKKSSGDGRGLVMRLFTFIWTLILILFYTLTDIVSSLATLWFVRDTQTPIKAERGGCPTQKRFVHMIASLGDVKLVKTAMNVSFNDVVLGVTEAGLSRYLNTIYENNREKNGKTLPKNLEIRSTVMFNLRPSPTIEDLAEMMEKEELDGMWGNLISIVILPLKIKLQEDPLTYIRRAKSIMDRKKLSLGHIFAFAVTKSVMFLFGIKAASRMVRSIFQNTTLTFSNVIGLKEEVNLFGHHLNYIAPSISGFPQSLAVHFQSYGDKLVISVGADEKLISNPLQLCDDFIASLQTMKEAVIKRGLVDVASQSC